MLVATLTLSTASLTIAQDATESRFLPATLGCTFTNISQVNDQLNLEVLGLPPEWVTHSLAGARLRPGMDSATQITILPPRVPSTIAGTRQFTVRVTSEEHPNAEPAEQTVTLTISPFTDPSAALVEPTLTAAAEVTIYHLRLRNGGNQSTAHDRFQEWVCHGCLAAAWALLLERYDEEIGLQWEWQVADGGIVKAPLGKRGPTGSRKRPAATRPTAARVAASATC